MSCQLVGRIHVLSLGLVGFIDANVLSTVCVIHKCFPYVTKNRDVDNFAVVLAILRGSVLRQRETPYLRPRVFRASRKTSGNRGKFQEGQASTLH